MMNPDELRMVIEGFALGLAHTAPVSIVRDAFSRFALEDEVFWKSMELAQALEIDQKLGGKAASEAIDAVNASATQVLDKHGFAYLSINSLGFGPDEKEPRE